MSNSLILSAAGLKNIFVRGNAEEEFEFIFGSHKIRMNRIFADFLSPFVSKIHHSDPTVSSIDFSNQIEGINLSEGIYILIEQLSQGISIEVNDEQLIQLQHLSIILQNEELFTLLNDKREKSHLNDNLEESLKYLKIWKLVFVLIQIKLNKLLISGSKSNINICYLSSLIIFLFYLLKFHLFL